MALDPAIADLLVNPEEEEPKKAPPSPIPASPTPQAAPAKPGVVPDAAASLLTTEEPQAQPAGAVVIDEYTKSMLGELFGPEKQEPVAKPPQAAHYDVARVATEAGIPMPNEPGYRDTPSALLGRKDQLNYIKSSLYGADVAGLKDAPLTGAYLLKKYANENGLDILFTSGFRGNSTTYHGHGEAVDVRVVRRGKSGQLYDLTPSEEVEWGAKLGKKAGFASMLNEIDYDPSGRKRGPHLHLSWGVERNLLHDPSHHLLNERYPEDKNYLSLNPKTKMAPKGDKARAGIPALAETIAQANGLDPDIFVRMVQAESNFDPAAKSSVGAEGLVQMMPDTVKEVATQLGVDPTEYYASPHMQLRFGAHYLKQQLKANGGNYARALAAYNAGPGALEEFKKGIKPVYAETRNYVKNILGDVDDHIKDDDSAVAAIVNGTGRTLDPEREVKTLKGHVDNTRSTVLDFFENIYQMASRHPMNKPMLMAQEMATKGVKGVIEDPLSETRKALADVTDVLGLGMGLDHFLPGFQSKLETREAQKAELEDDNMLFQLHGAVERNAASLAGMYIGGKLLHKALRGLPGFEAVGNYLGTKASKTGLMAAETLATGSGNAMLDAALKEATTKAVSSGKTPLGLWVADLWEQMAVGGAMMGTSHAVNWATTEGNDPTDVYSIAKQFLTGAGIGGVMAVGLGAGLPLAGGAILNTLGNISGKTPMANDLIGALSKMYKNQGMGGKTLMRTIGGGAVGGLTSSLMDMTGVTETLFGEGTSAMPAGTSIGMGMGAVAAPAIAKAVDWTGLSKAVADSPMSKYFGEWAGKVVDSLNTQQMQTLTRHIEDSVEQHRDLSARVATHATATGAILNLDTALKYNKGSVAEAANKLAKLTSEAQKAELDFQNLAKNMEMGEQSYPAAKDYLDTKAQLQAEYAQIQKQQAELAKQAGQGQVPSATPPIPGVSAEAQQAVAAATAPTTPQQQAQAVQLNAQLLGAKLQEITGRMEELQKMEKDTTLGPQIRRLEANRSRFAQAKAAYEAQKPLLDAQVSNTQAMLQGLQDTEKTLTGLREKAIDVREKAMSPDDFKTDWGNVIEMPGWGDNVHRRLLDPEKMGEAYQSYIGDFVNQVMDKAIFQGSSIKPEGLVNELSAQYMTLRAPEDIRGHFGDKLKEMRQTLKTLKEPLKDLKDNAPANVVRSAYKSSLGPDRRLGGKLFSKGKKKLQDLIKKQRVSDSPLSKLEVKDSWADVDLKTAYNKFYEEALQQEIESFSAAESSYRKRVHEDMFPDDKAELPIAEEGGAPPAPEVPALSREEAIVRVNKRLAEKAKDYRTQLMWGEAEPASAYGGNVYDRLGYAQALMDMGETRMLLDAGSAPALQGLRNDMISAYKSQKLREYDELVTEIEATSKLLEGPLANPIIPALKQADASGKPYAKEVSGPWAQAANPLDVMNAQTRIKYLSKRVEQLETSVKGQPLTPAEAYQNYVRYGGDLNMTPEYIREFIKNKQDLSKASPEVRAWIDHNTLQQVEEIQRVRWLDKNVIGQAAGGKERIVSAIRELRATAIPEKTSPEMKQIIDFLGNRLLQLDSTKVMELNRFMTDLIRSDQFKLSDIFGMAAKGWHDLVVSRKNTANVVIDEMINPTFNMEFEAFKKSLGKEFTPVEEQAFFREMADAVEDVGEMGSFRAKYGDKVDGLLNTHYNIQSLFEMIRANSPELYDWARANYWPHRWKRLAEHNAIAQSMNKVGISAELASEHAREYASLKYADAKRQEFRDILKKKGITEDEYLGLFDSDRAKLLEYGRDPSAQAQWDRLDDATKKQKLKDADKRAILLLADDPVLDPRELYRMQFSSIWRADAVRQLLRLWNNTEIPGIGSKGEPTMYKLMMVGEGNGNYPVSEMVNGVPTHTQRYHKLGEMDSFKNVKLRHPDYAEPVSADKIWVHPQVWRYLNEFVGGDNRPATGTAATIARGWQKFLHVARNQILIGPFFSHLNQMISGSMGEFWRNPMRAANLMGAGKKIRTAGLEGSAALAEATRSGLNVRILEHGTKAIADSLIADYGLDTANKIYGVENAKFMKFLQAIDPTDPAKDQARAQLGKFAGAAADVVGSLTNADYVMNREMLFKPIEQGQLAGFYFRTMEYLKEHQTELMQLPPEQRLNMAQQWAADMTNRYMGTMPEAIMNNKMRQMVNNAVTTPNWWLSKALTIADGLDSMAFIAGRVLSGGRIKRSIAEVMGREAFAGYPPEMRMAVRQRMATGIMAGLMGTWASTIAAQYMIDGTMPWEGSPPDKWLHLRYGGNYITGPTQGFTRDLFKDVLHLIGESEQPSLPSWDRVVDTVGRAISKQMVPPVKGVAAMLLGQGPEQTQRDQGFVQNALTYLDHYSAQLTSAPELAGLETDATFSDLAAKLFYPFLNSDKKAEVSAKTLTGGQYMARFMGGFDSKNEGEFMRARGDIYDRKRALEMEGTKALAPYLNKIRIYSNSGDSARMSEAMQSLMQAYSKGVKVNDKALKTMYPAGYRISQEKLSSLIRRAIAPQSAAFQGASPEVIYGMSQILGDSEVEE